MFLDGGVDQPSTEPAQPIQRPLVVKTDQSEYAAISAYKIATSLRRFRGPLCSAESVAATMNPPREVEAYQTWLPWGEVELLR